MFLDLANLSAITIALPTIEKQFSVHVGDLQWVISAYALTFGAFLLLGGRGGDMFGHRNILIFGMSFFALFTLVSALSPNFIGLVIARAFQGIGAAFTVPSAQAYIALFFSEPKAKATALGYWAASGSVGFVVGLILGGVLTDFVGWRWIFWISLMISAVVIPSACLVLPPTDTKREAPSNQTNMEASNAEESGPTTTPGLYRISRSILNRLIRFDVLGIGLGLSGILLLNYALSTANSLGWGSGQILGTLIPAVLLLAFFGFQENRAAVSLLPSHLFRSLSFNLTLILAAISFAIRQGCTYFLTLQLQSYGASPVHTSVLFLPLGITALLFFPVSGKILGKIGARNMYILGHILALAGVLLFSFITPTTSYFAFTFPGMILYLLGIGCVYFTSNVLVVSAATKSDQGVAAAMFNVAVQVGGSVLGLAVLTAVAQGITKRYGDGVEKVGQVGYRAVYYSCAILCVVGFFISVFGIEVASKNPGARPSVQEVADAHEMVPVEEER